MFKTFFIIWMTIFFSIAVNSENIKQAEITADIYFSEYFPCQIYKEYNYEAQSKSQDKSIIKLSIICLSCDSEYFENESDKNKIISEFKWTTDFGDNVIMSNTKTYLINYDTIKLLKLKSNNAMFGDKEIIYRSPSEICKFPSKKNTELKWSNYKEGNKKEKYNYTAKFIKELKTPYKVFTNVLEVRKKIYSNFKYFGDEVLYFAKNTGLVQYELSDIIYRLVDIK